MAKTRPISKIAKVTEELRTQNEAISDLQKNVSEIETISLLILEKLRRIEKNPVVKTKNGKIIPAKTMKSPLDSLQPANDPINSIGEKSADSILLKIYNFMVRNSEKEKDQRNLDRSLEKEKRQEKKKKYEKVAKDSGIDPKTLKKRGFLSKVGSVLKGGVLVAMGTALAGLVYLFKDEILEFGKKILKGIVDVGDIITSVTDFIKKSFEQFMKFVEPVVKWFNESPFIQSLMEKGKSIKEGITETGSGVINWVTEQFKSFTKGLSEWVRDLIPQILSTVGKGLISLANTASNWAKENPGSVAGVIAGFFGPPWMKAVSAAFGIGKAVTAASGFAKDIRFGEEYQKSVENIIHMHPQYKGKEISSTMLQDAMDDPKLLKNIIEDKSVKETKEQYADRVGKSMGIVKKLPGMQREHLTNLMQGSDYSIDEESDKKALDMEKDPFEKLKMQPDIKGKDKQHIDLKNREQFYDVMLPLYVEKKVADPIKQSIVELGNEVSNNLETSLNNKFEQLVDENKDRINSVENAVGRAKETVSQTATRVGDSATQMASNVTSAVKQNYADAKTPGDYIAATATPAINAAESLGKGTLMPGLESLATKVENVDYVGLAKQSYGMVNQGLNTALEFGKKIQDASESGDLMKMLSPEAAKTNEIKQDPNEDPFNLNAIYQQRKDAASQTVNKVLNNNSTTSSSENYSSIPVRNLYGPFRNSNILNTVNP